MPTLVMQRGEWLKISKKDAQWPDVRILSVSADLARAVSLAALPTPSDGALLVEALGANYMCVSVPDAGEPTDDSYTSALARLHGADVAADFNAARFGVPCENPAYAIQIALTPGQPWTARRTALAAYRSQHPEQAGYSFAAQSRAIGERA